MKQSNYTEFFSPPLCLQHLYQRVGHPSIFLRLTCSRTDKVSSLRACTYRLLFQNLRKTICFHYKSLFYHGPRPGAPPPPTAMLDPSRTCVLRCSSLWTINNAVFFKPWVRWLRWPGLSHDRTVLVIKFAPKLSQGMPFRCLFWRFSVKQRHPERDDSQKEASKAGKRKTYARAELNNVIEPPLYFSADILFFWFWTKPRGLTHKTRTSLLTTVLNRFSDFLFNNGTPNATNNSEIP